MPQQERLRVGLIGANASYGWAPRAHIPARANKEAELHDVGEVAFHRDFRVVEDWIDALDGRRVAENPPFRGLVLRLAAGEDGEQGQGKKRREKPGRRLQCKTSRAFAACAAVIPLDHSRTDASRGSGLPAHRGPRSPVNQPLGAIARRQLGLSVRGGPGAVKIKPGGLRRLYSMVIDRSGRRHLDAAPAA